MSTPLFNKKLPSFDELMILAQNNPDAFCQLKKDMCEEMILSASEEMQERLRAQQSHIDLVVSTCKNPNQANVLLMRELVSQLIKFQDVLDGDSDKLDRKFVAEVISLDEWR